MSDSEGHLSRLDAAHRAADLLLEADSQLADSEGLSDRDLRVLALEIGLAHAYVAYAERKGI